MGFGFWETAEQGQRWLLREENNGFIQRVGSVMRYDRWENVYAKDWRPEKILHDNILADLIGLIQPERFTCRKADPTVGADAEVWLTPRLELWYVELHRATGQNVAELNRERFPRYAAIEHPVLWVIEANQEEDERTRLEAMIRAEAVTERMRFCTFTDLMESPEEEILIGRNGHRSRLPDV